MQRVPGLYFGPSSIHGRGVFCAHDITSGDMIEIAPVIPLEETPVKLLDSTLLYEYYFMWGVKQKTPAIVLGYGSLYNHSGTPNATFVPDLKKCCMLYSAVRDIPAGEEITIDFHEGMPGKKVWFDAKE